MKICFQKASISRESYLALSHQETEKLIKQYYSDMNSRTGSGMLFVLIFF